jgi:hypothetical protein
VPTQESQQATEDGVRRFASGEGAATQQEVSDIDDKVDPDRQLDEGDRQMVRLAKTVQWYMSQGREDDAKMAAGSLMQYGAQRFSQIGNLAATAYRQYQQGGDPKDLDNTIRFLEQAYKMIPDGANLDVQLNTETGKLQATHTDADGDAETYDIDASELPGFIKQTMDNSMYWKSMLSISDPALARQRESEEQSDIDVREERKYKEGQTKEERKYKEGQTEEEHTYEEKKTIAQEEREAKRKAEEDKAAAAAEIEKEKRAATESDRVAKRNAEIATDAKLRDIALKELEPDKKVDLTKARPAMAKAAAARVALAANQDDPDAQAAYAEAASRLFDAVGNDADWMDKNGFPSADFTYTEAQPEGPKVDPKDLPAGVQGPDKNGRYWKKLPNGKFKEVIPETS